MQKLLGLVLALALPGCSLITLDLTPRIQPLAEQTVEGAGRAKILLVDVSGFLSDEGPSPGLLGTAPPRVPMLVRLREELKKAADDPDVRALVLRINSPGGTVTASDIIWRELDGWKRATRRP
ncbi:MAG: signal peptide peptidase SppA, partial [candidate division NC10 bacterium]